MFGKSADSGAPSEREHLIIRRVAEGCKNSEIAEALGTTEDVVKNYLRLNTGHPWTTTMARAIQKLAQLLRRY